MIERRTAATTSADRGDRQIRFAGLVTLSYLVVTLPLLWRGDPGAHHQIVRFAHVVGMLGVWWATRPRSRPNVVAEWLPLVLVPLLYAELPYLMGPGVVYNDSLVQRWEAGLFAGQPSRTLAGALPYGALSELLHLGYLAYYPVIFVPPLVFYASGRREAFARALVTLMLTYAACFLAFIVFAVQGPRYVWGPPTSVPSGPLRSLTVFILERGSSRGAAFPSSHAAIAIAQAAVTIRYDPRLGVCVAFAASLLMIGAVYGGFHYAVDILAGAVVGLAMSLVTLVRR